MGFPSVVPFFNTLIFISESFLLGCAEYCGRWTVLRARAFPVVHDPRAVTVRLALRGATFYDCDFHDALPMSSCERVTARVLDHVQQSVGASTSHGVTAPVPTPMGFFLEMPNCCLSPSTQGRLFLQMSLMNP